MQDVGDFCIVSDCVLEKCARRQTIKKYDGYVLLELSGFWEACRCILMSISNFFKMCMTKFDSLRTIFVLWQKSWWGLNACVFVAAKADLRGYNVRFFQNDSVFVCQLLAVSFSLVLVFYDRKKNFKNIAVGVL